MIEDRAREKMIDRAYNRFAVDDLDRLPQWFVDDEAMHRRPNLPVTKADIREMKKRWQEINARPIKKVVEAKARKKMKQIRKLEKAQKTASKIVDNPEMTERAKSKAVEEIYKKASKVVKPTKLYVVSKKFSTNPRRKSNHKTKIVDKRMKKDLRATKAKNKKRPNGGKAQKNKRQRT